MVATAQPQRRRKGDGSVRWIPARERWEIRAVIPATRHRKPKRVSRYIPDPAKYRGAWPSAAGQKAAERALDELVAEIKRGVVDAKPAARAMAANVTLDTFVATHWESWLVANTATPGAPNRRLRPKVADEYRLVYRSRIAPTLGHRAITSLAPLDVDVLVEALTNAKRKPKPLSEASVHRTGVVLRSVLKVAERGNLIPEGTAARFKANAGAGAPAVEAPEATEEQMRALLKLCARRPAAAARRLSRSAGPQSTGGVAPWP